MVNSVIVSAVRTPIGSFQGSLAKLAATELGAAAISEAVGRAKVKPDEIDEVLMGCVLAAGLGQNPARQAALAAGLPKSIATLTLNRVCSSGLRAVMLADQLIRCGDHAVVVAGGMESMTNAPYLLPQARAGMRLGDAKAVDSMVHDGLWDAHTDRHMGACAELCAEKYGFTRQQQDEFARVSYERAQAAVRSGAFKDEIVPIAIPQRRGEPLIFATDEEPGRADFARMPTLKASFKPDGTITAANASSISDGAAALVVMSEAKAKGAKGGALARIVAHAAFSHEPEWFTTAPIEAIKLVLEKASLTTQDIDLFEINEASSAVTMAAVRELSLDESRVNVSGGAVAFGHPIGASGARILVTLIHAMRARKARRGLAALCNGGGGATAMIVESV